MDENHHLAKVRVALLSRTVGNLAQVADGDVRRPY